jgi:MYXO-CTERM domain-containing protein
MRFIAIACLLGVELYAGGAQAMVLWRGDFETGDLKQWSNSTLIKTGDRDNLVLEGDTVADGSKAAQITLRPDIIFEPYNQSRVEVTHTGLHTKNGEDSYFAWSFMLPADAEIRSNIGYWESTPSYKNTMTFFIEPAQGGGTNLKFGTGDLGQTVRFTTKLELNKWHRLAIHNHWSQSQTDGKVDVWYDGTQVVSGAVAAKFNADQLFFTMGLHRSDPAPPVQVIYIDAALEADSQDEIVALLPGQTTGGAGAGGMAGASGAGGSSAGGGGASGGEATGGVMSGGVAGAGAAGAVTGGGGTAGIAGAAVLGGGGTSAGSTGQGGAGNVTPPTASADDAGSCTFSGQATDDANARPWLALVGLGVLTFRRRRRTPKAQGKTKYF